MTSYDDDSGAPTWELIEERWVTARRPHPCDGACSTGIPVGDSYWRVAGKLDGEFTLTLTCGYCQHGQTRPGTTEHAALIAETERYARQDEEDYEAELAFARRVVANPDQVDPDMVAYAQGILG